MHLDLHTEVSEREEDMHKLYGRPETREFGGPQEEVHSNRSTTILKVLAIIAGVFFSLLAATTAARVEVAFISITLITLCTGAILLGAEKIVDLLPDKLLIWRDYSVRTGWEVLDQDDL